MPEWMRPLDVRRGAMSRAAVLIVLSGAIAGQSDTPLVAFAETMIVGLAGIALAVRAMLLFDRGRRRPAGR